MRPFDVIPVLDLQNGIVVRGVAGQRNKYQPNKSRWTTSTAPLETALALRKQFGLSSLYVADLDAIQAYGSHLLDVQQLQAHGFQLLLDAGIRTAAQAQQYSEEGIANLVIGLETLPDWAALESMLHVIDPSRITFSLDMKQGLPLGPLGEQRQPLAIVHVAWNYGIRRFILLDLAAVGTGTGVPTLPLCRTIRAQYPESHLITGGGVRHEADVDAVRGAGLDGVLVASALHDGQLTTI